MIYNILIIGAGQLGSRYLEGLAKSKLYLKIIVLDKSSISIKKAKKKWILLNKNSQQRKISWHYKLPPKISKYDLVIVSTTSFGRAKLISDISKKVYVKYWILEKLLAQSVKELDLICSSTSNSINAFVNTPRRAMKWYKNIKSQLLNKQIKKVFNNDNKWGLACNAIHYIDLVTWLSGKSIVSVSTKNLKKKWFKSKRNDYYEIDGELIVKFQDGIELFMRSNPNLKKNLRINFSDKSCYFIDEVKGIASLNYKKKILSKNENKSEMTSSLIQKILIDGYCDLPILSESITQHKKLITSLLKHWNKVNNCESSLLPVT